MDSFVIVSPAEGGGFTFHGTASEPASAFPDKATAEETLNENAALLPVGSTVQALQQFSVPAPAEDSPASP